MGVILKIRKILSVSKSDFWPHSKKGLPVQIVVKYQNSGNSVDHTKTTVKREQKIRSKQKDKFKKSLTIAE